MRRQAFFQLSVVIMFGAAAYANSFSNEFLYDDEHYIQRNPWIRDCSHLQDIFTQNVVAGSRGKSNFYRPMQLVAYAVVYRFFTLKVFGFHLLNFLLHSGNAVLVYFLLRALLKREDMPFIASLLFMVHPVQTEAVTYMNGTADPLAAFWGLLSIFLYVKAVNRPVARVGSWFCFAAALLSKETIVILPFLIVGVDVYRGEFSGKRLAKYLPYLVLAGGYFILRLTALNFTRSLNLFRESNIYTENLRYRIYTFLASLMEYYKVLLFPLNLKYDRALTVFVSIFTPKVLWSFGLLLGFLCLAGRSLTKDKKVVFLGLSWFFIALVPVTGIIPINGFAMEHWLYFPSVGFLIIFSRLLASVGENGCPHSGKGKALSGRRYLPGLLAIAVMFTALTRDRNKVWREPIRFYTKILEHNPDLARVRNNLAMAYSARGMPAEAERQYRTAIALEDCYPEAHHNLALLYLEKGMNREGIAELKQAIALSDGFIYSHLVLREVYEKLGRDEEARREAGKIEKILSR